ncbi:hypothetical protein C8Q80DRAFT_1099078 [Daedaleopsis nitida]|nr:hypothetical protein C8Q80DRAFT_1099078 [Daedaleopsis nitida]
MWSLLCPPSVRLKHRNYSVNDGGYADTVNTRKRAAPSTIDDNQRRRHWFPWHDKITCTLDILMHLPRSVFSQRQLDLFLWLLRVNGMEDVPSVRSMLSMNAKLQGACGIDSVPYQGALGHAYYVNSLQQILAQEVANPRVRPFLHFYPEDTGGRVLGEARQGAQWLKEAPNETLTPMLRYGSHDYYVHEPVMLHDGSVCMPVRWFSRVMLNGEQSWYAKGWRMEVVTVDSRRGWRVIQDNEFEIRADMILKGFEELKQDASHYRLPEPSCILDVYNPQADTLSSWTLTDPVCGNQWRARSKGHRVMSMPLWMYCDDTSGNLSKKWNEHNSVLFTLAGLPREHVQKEYNIHFLTTSNITPPLEMMDGVVDQLEAAQREGVWAWDGQLQEPVLLVPFVLALLGDNPMQSEFACHMGMRAKFFCRNCWVKGKDATDVAERSYNPDATAEGTTGARSQGAGPQTRGKGKKRLEGMADMLKRVRAFITVRRPRTKAETAHQLHSYFDLASTPDGKSKVAKERTRTGIKDTFQLFHVQKLFSSYKDVRGYDAKQRALNEAIARLPEHNTNPIWRIQELDAHQDTPVEVLHVVLLGFVKYLWCDLVQEQLKNKENTKTLLATRLSSVDVSGLGISPLVGNTLVQYAGSLTGRDFRAIAQVAPFVIYDMVSPECYEAWIALSKLIPLIWQPVIYDVSTYLSGLEKEIHHFLLCTARWTVRWFNKPKFHIILHLVEHIRRFGPAALFATEAFESFNAVIRAKSVHSNRQAPSRDIARAFAQGNRICHLLSGGYFRYRGDGLAAEEGLGHRGDGSSWLRSDWTTVGEGPRSLVQTENTVTSYLGLEPKNDTSKSTTLHSCTAKAWPHMVPTYAPFKFQESSDLTLLSGDRCKVGDFLIAANEEEMGKNELRQVIGRVAEILTAKGTAEDAHHRPNLILLQCCSTSRPHETYRMPHVDLQDSWKVVEVQDLICTVNVQHNCAHHKCTDSDLRPVRQERQVTEQTTRRVRHTGDIDDLILNTAQMQDARYVQKFRLPAPILDQNTVILKAVQDAIDTQKQASRAIGNPRSKTSGSSRGTPTTRGCSRARGGSSASGRVHQLQGQAEEHAGGGGAQGVLGQVVHGGELNGQYDSLSEKAILITCIRDRWMTPPSSSIHTWTKETAVGVEHTSMHEAKPKLRGRSGDRVCVA